MRIACVYHPKPYLQNPTAQYGLGLLALATLARACGGSVSVLDGQGESAEWVPAAKADVWLFSACLVDAPIINRLIDRLDGDSIVGGPISHSPDVVSKRAKVVAGPGEPLIEQFIQEEVFMLEELIQMILVTILAILMYYQLES